MARVRKGTGEREREIRALVGGTIRQMRQARGLSVAQLATLADMDRSHLSKIESGRHLANVAALERIAFELGLTLSAIYAVALSRKGVRG